jgi:hypothetical protein
MVSHDQLGSHGDGSRIWTSAISVALGDGMLPRPRERRARKDHRRAAAEQPDAGTRRTAG